MEGNLRLKAIVISESTSGFGFTPDINWGDVSASPGLTRFSRALVEILMPDFTGTKPKSLEVNLSRVVLVWPTRLALVPQPQFDRLGHLQFSTPTNQHTHQATMVCCHAIAMLGISH